MAAKNLRQDIFSPISFVVAGSGMEKNQDPGSASRHRTTTSDIS